MYEEELEVAIKVRNLWLFSPALIAARAANNILLLQRDFFITSSFIFAFLPRAMTKQPADREAYFIFSVYVCVCVTYILCDYWIERVRNDWARFLFVESWKRWRDLSGISVNCVLCFN
jgi:hypothetical protein